MVMMPDLIAFPTRAAMTERLVDLLVLTLSRAIAEKGAAHLAVSGGSSPQPLYQLLSQQALDWSRVTATLVDERWVAPGEDGSNQTFIENCLVQNEARRMHLNGLWQACPFEEAAELINEQYRDLPPFDAVILGMGPDGHTASWFPHAPQLERVLSSADKFQSLTAIRSTVTGVHLERITMTPAALRGATVTCLMIAGSEKKQVFEKARQAGTIEEFPVCQLLQTTPKLWACWAP